MYSFLTIMQNLGVAEKVFMARTKQNLLRT
jgi:hypothetical protein